MSNVLSPWRRPATDPETLIYAPPPEPAFVIIEGLSLIARECCASVRQVEEWLRAGVLVGAHKCGPEWRISSVHLDDFNASRKAEDRLAAFLVNEYPRADWTMRDVEALAVKHSPDLGMRHLVDDAFIARVSVLLRKTPKNSHGEPV